MATDVERLIVSLEARQNQMERELSKATRNANTKARQIETRFQQMNRNVTSSFAGIGVGAFTGLIAGATAALAPLALVRNAMDAIAEASKMAKVADRVGLTTKAFQELQFGMSLAGVEAGQFEKGMEKFTDVIGDAATKGGRLADILKANGVALRDGAGNIRPNIDLLRDYANLIKNAGSEQEQMTLATEAFGDRAGRAFVTALNGGSDALDDFVQQTADAGGVIDEELLRRAEVLDDKFEALWRTFSVRAKSALLVAAFGMEDLIAQTQDWLDRLDRGLTELGNAGVFEKLLDLLERMGMISTDITFVDPMRQLTNETRHAEIELASLQSRLETLHAALANGSELGFDTSETEAEIAKIESKIAELQALISQNTELGVDTSVAHQKVDALSAAITALRMNMAQVAGEQAALLAGDQAAFDKAFTAPTRTVIPGGSDKKKKGGGGGKSKADPLERGLEQIRERIALLQAETAVQAQLNPLIDDYGYALTKAKTTQELLNAAKKAGITVTPELRAQIDALAESYASATVEANQLAEGQDRVREAAEEMRSLGKDVLGGFIRDLREGKSGAEALANALNKVADKLLDIALNSLFSSKGGGFGGLFSFIPKLFGFADGGVAAHGRPLKKFARGGVSRSAAIFGEAGPEAAVPLPDGRRIPVDLRVPGVQQAAKSGTETIHVVLQDDSGRMAEIADQRIQTSAGTIVQVSVQQSVKTVKQQMPGLMANAQARNG